MEIWEREKNRDHVKGGGVEESKFGAQSLAGSIQLVALLRLLRMKLVVSPSRV